jgi:hypothetical protein
MLGNNDKRTSSNGIWSRALSRTEISNLYSSSNTGIDKMKETQITIYPNPLSKLCTVNCPFLIKKLELIKSNGQIIIASTPNANYVELDLSLLSNGAYTLMINDEYQKQIIKN